MKAVLRLTAVLLLVGVGWQVLEFLSNPIRDRCQQGGGVYTRDGLCAPRK